MAKVQVPLEENLTKPRAEYEGSNWKTSQQTDFWVPPAPAMDQGWYHGNITRSRAEDLLSKVGKDGSFLVRASESIASAYALCVLFRNCVYTYRILPDKENKLIVQFSGTVTLYM
ncbi:phosphatidylinositol -trisphosphate 5-phosphatase 1 [Limosa lapponica baueri]|uniref:Phosphatidylinositol-trisphosphate 5-phosphatase 1 n=1 Tax=Limosa lapponica baueri TaxID=1758121 RepID=A0A2I0TLL2_LIMLA|nr:phosphatidylinositol -trisphosphate 5-phosphatase 1 [Limosa lapponica baueri]